MPVGIDRQVAEHLAEELGVDLDAGVLAVHLHRGPHQRHELGHQPGLVGDPHRLGIHGEGVGVHPGGDEQVVHHPAQLRRLSHDQVHRLRVFGGERPGWEEVGEPDDPGKGGAQLVGHPGDQAVLELVQAAFTLPVEGIEVRLQAALLDAGVELAADEDHRGHQHEVEHRDGEWPPAHLGSQGTYQPGGQGQREPGGAAQPEGLGWMT